VTVRDSDVDVLVVGGAGVDTIVRVPELPLPVNPATGGSGARHPDSIGVEPITEYVAHTGTGVALGCHALGLATTFVDYIGDDHAGELIRRRYAAVGLDFRWLTSPAGTRRAVNLVAPSGERLSLYDGRDTEDLRMPRSHYVSLLHKARHVHVSIMPFARFMLDDIADAGVPMSTDLHDWDGRNDYHREFAYRADLVFLSTASIGDRFAEVMRDILHNGRASLVVGTAGVAGAWLLTREADDEPRLFPSVRSRWPTVDTNGAGDAFVTGFLAGRLGGRELDDCLRLGAIAGAYACSTPGTHTGFLDADTLFTELDRAT
jgi:sugar/nucleoside kinase (ribokinase family)